MHLDMILREELVQALGCTEPIAIAFAAANLRKILKLQPSELTFFNILCSTNIIKNAKSVYVPMTNGLKGIQAAAAIGFVGGDPSLGLQVLSPVTAEDIEQTTIFLEKPIFNVNALETPFKLDIFLLAGNEEHSAEVRITQKHDHLTFMRKNQEILLDVFAECKLEDEVEVSLSLDEIYTYAINADLSNVQDLFDRQIACNVAISDEGLRERYGVNIGQNWLRLYGREVASRAVARAAAGSDARMSGCDLPVVINSGSGNQGMTVSLPVWEYAQELNSSSEQLYRALALANLIAIYQKRNIGRLSAFCGVVNAASGAAAAIAYLRGGTKEQIFKSMEYVLGTMSGMVCDGAKASCASKIAMSVQSAVVGADLSLSSVGYLSGDGLIQESPTLTVDSIIRLAKEGMRTTDEIIIREMLHSN